MNEALDQQIIVELLAQARPFLPLICKPRPCTRGEVRAAVIAKRPPNTHQWWVREHVLLLTPDGNLVEAYESQTLGLSVSPTKRWGGFPIESIVAGFSGVMSQALILDAELKEQRARFDSKLKRILAILREN